MKSLFLKNWYFYIFGLIIICGLKLYYSTADFNDLGWILAPTTWWTKVLSGNTFERVADIGYINHANEFMIVASCSGVNYLMILFSAMIYPFIHRWNTFKQKLLWFFSSVIIAYLLTIGVNGLRIVLAMHLFNADIYGGIITPQRIHSIEGILIYFISLFITFIIADGVIGYINSRLSTSDVGKQFQVPLKAIVKTSMYPVFCYLIMTLGIPIIDRAYKRDIPGFIEHAIIIITVCLISVVVYCLSTLIIHKTRKNLT